MPGRLVAAREVLLDIERGMKDSELMAKYKLSQKGLEDLYRRLSDAGLLKTVSRSRSAQGPRKINAAAITNDILAGMSDGDLMKRYALSAQELQQVFERLIQSGVFLSDKIGENDKSSIQLADAKTEECRLTFRHEVDFVLPIFDEKDEDALGTVLNISEMGLGVRGISSKVGERKILVIPADEFFDVGRLTVQATCRWSAKDPADGEPLAGFELVPQSFANVAELRNLINLVDSMKAVETTDFKAEGEPARELRRAVRYNCPFPVPIHDALHAQNKGRILNVSTEGLAIEGMTWQEGDKKTLVIPAYQYGRRQFKSIVLIAECRWARQAEGEELVCGLRIIDRTAKNYEEFQELVRTCASAGA